MRKLKKRRARTKIGTWNKFEDAVHEQLTNANVSFKYESIRIPYVIYGHYIPDFILETPTGVVYIEAKGYFRPEAKRKMAAVKRQHPELDLRILFYSENKTNARWAEKNGIRYAVGNIPQSWLEGF